MKEYRKFTEGPGQVKKKKAQTIQYTWIRTFMVINLMKRLNLIYKVRVYFKIEKIPLD